MGNDDIVIEPFPTKTYTGLPDTPNWTFEGLLEAGTCAVLAAEPKAGKTWFTMDAGICLATGQQFLGQWSPVNTGPTLFYSPEGGDRSRHARLVGLCWGRGVNPDDVLPRLPFLEARLDMSVASHALRLGATMDVTGARLVVIDPLVSASFGIDENSSGDVMRILDPLRDVIKERPYCSMIVAHHTNKMASKGSLAMGLRGSSAIGGWWDTLITLRREDDDSSGPKRVDVFHRDALAPPPLGFQLAHGDDADHPGHSWFRMDPCAPAEMNSKGRARGTPGRKEDQGLSMKIIELVDRLPGQLNRYQLAKRLGENKPKMNRYVNRLIEAGAVKDNENNTLEICEDDG